MSIEKTTLYVDALSAGARAVLALRLTPLIVTLMPLIERRDGVREVVPRVLAELQSARVAQQEAPRRREPSPLRGVGRATVSAHAWLRLVVVQHELLLIQPLSTHKLQRRLRVVVEGIDRDVRVGKVLQLVPQSHVRVLAQLLRRVRLWDRNHFCRLRLLARVPALLVVHGVERRGEAAVQTLLGLCGSALHPTPTDAVVVVAVAALPLLSVARTLPLGGVLLVQRSVVRQRRGVERVHGLHGMNRPQGPVGAVGPCGANRIRARKGLRRVARIKQVKDGF